MPAYSATLMEHFQTPRNAGSLASPDRVGKVGDPGKGPFMVLHLCVVNHIVKDARYRTYGCGPAIAAGSVFTERIKGRSVQECLAVTAKDIETALGGLPADKRFCAGLPIKAFQNAFAT